MLMPSRCLVGILCLSFLCRGKCLSCDPSYTRCSLLAFPTLLVECGRIFVCCEREDRSVCLRISVESNQLSGRAREPVPKRTSGGVWALQRVLPNDIKYQREKETCIMKLCASFSSKWLTTSGILRLNLQRRCPSYLEAQQFKRLFSLLFLFFVSAT